MKHLTQKNIVLILILMLFTIFVGVEKASAYDNTNVQGDLKIDAIGNVESPYFSDKEVKYLQGNSLYTANVEEIVNKSTKEIEEEKNLEEAFKRINAGIGSTNDYKIIGIENKQLNNLRQLNVAIKIARESKQSDLTKNEIELIIKDLPKKIGESFKKVNAGTATLNDYELIGITGVTEINLIDVNEALKGKEYTTLSKAQSAADTIINLLIVMNSGTIINGYYTNMGITTVNSKNAKVVMESIKAAKTLKKQNLTKAEIHQVVNEALNRIEKLFQAVNAGTATLDDYKLIGVTGVTEINLVDVNEALKGKGYTTLNRIQPAVNTMIGSLKVINSGTIINGYYRNIGITTVNSKNAKAVMENIKAARALKKQDLTKAEINQVVNEILNRIENLFKVVNAGTANLDSYKLIGVTGVTEINLVDVNEALKGKGYTTLNKVQSAANIIISSLKSINTGTISNSYYKNIGVTTVTSKNAKVVMEGIKAARTLKKQDLTKAEINQVVNDVLNRIEKLFQAVNAGTATLDDYKLIGVTGVTEINLVDVNEALKGKGYTTLNKVQPAANVVISSLKSINTGTISTSYYRNIGITTVNSKNAKAVKEAIIAAKTLKKQNLTKAEINQVVDDVLKKSGH